MQHAPPAPAAPEAVSLLAFAARLDAIRRHRPGSVFAQLCAAALLNDPALIPHALVAQFSALQPASDAAFAGALRSLATTGIPATAQFAAIHAAIGLLAAHYAGPASIRRRLYRQLEGLAGPRAPWAFGALNTLRQQGLHDDTHAGPPPRADGPADGPAAPAHDHPTNDTMLYHFENDVTLATPESGSGPAIQPYTPGPALTAYTVNGTTYPASCTPPRGAIGPWLNVVLAATKPNAWTHAAVAMLAMQGLRADRHRNIERMTQTFLRLPKPMLAAVRGLVQAANAGQLAHDASAQIRRWVHAIVRMAVPRGGVRLTRDGDPGPRAAIEALVLDIVWPAYERGARADGVARPAPPTLLTAYLLTAHIMMFTNWARGLTDIVPGFAPTRATIRAVDAFRAAHRDSLTYDMWADQLMRARYEWRAPDIRAA
jgi:hypothetical protein